MKLVHSDLEGHIIRDDDVSSELIIEDPMAFRRYILELLDQVNGYDGGFALSIDNRCIDLSKSVEVILDPISLEINEKRIINKIYKDLENISCAESLYLKSQEVINTIYNYLVELELECDYELDIKPELEMATLFKAADIKLNTSYDDLLEKIVIYIKTRLKVINKKLFIFVNLRSYLNEGEIIRLLEEVKYMEIKILLIEGVDRGFKLFDHKYIIDKDDCEIF